MILKETNIGVIAEVQTGPFGSQLHNEDYVLRGTPIVTVEHLGQKQFSSQNLPCVSNTDRKRLMKYTLKNGDIVFSRVGSVDRCSYVTNAEDGWLFSGRCLRVRVSAPDVISEYLYYYFCQDKVKDFIKNIAVGATMPSINTRLLAEVPFSYPSREKQIEIVGILSGLDAKIESNTAINTNLEAVAA